MRSRRTFLLGGILALTACGGADHSGAVELAGGNADRGKVATQRYGCNACHAIAGLPDPTVPVAAPITGIANRAYIAGTLSNNPRNLMTWIQHPHQVKPNTAMPDLGVSASEARDIATYLYSLH